MDGHPCNFDAPTVHVQRYFPRFQIEMASVDVYQNRPTGEESPRTMVSVCVHLFLELSV